MSSSADVSPSITPSTTPLSGQHAPKYGTVIPNRIFVGGIAANTTEAELKQFFTAYGAVKDTKIIADRAGVSKGYGFVTFENLEDAERIIKKEGDNLVFKERKLNIGPAIRKQVLPRTYDPNLPAGTVLFTNGVPYTYQNGMAIFHAPEGGYQIPQPQPSYTTAVMMPQTPTTMYMAPTYSAYQPLPCHAQELIHRIPTSDTSTPQWTTAAAAAAQWRWAPQSPGQPSVTTSPGYVFATMHSSPELMYAQAPPQAYQPADITDATLMEGAPVEGSVVPVEKSLASRMHANETNSSEQPPVSTMIPLQTPKTTSGITAYKTPITIPRRTFTSPTYLVKHGNKVKRLMVSSSSPAALYGSHIAATSSDAGELAEGYIKVAYPIHAPTN